MSESSAIAAIMDGELVSPERNSGSKEYLPSSSHQSAGTLYSEPWGTQNVKKQEPIKNQVPIKGVISVSLDFVPQSMALQRVRHEWVTKKQDLWTKVRIVKVMVFSVAMYGCDSWTKKKAESQRIDTFELWC